MKKCKYCQVEIDEKAKVCPNCKKDLRNYFIQHKALTIIIIVIVIPMIIGLSALSNNDIVPTYSNNVNGEVPKNKIEKTYVEIGENISTKDWEVKIDEVKFAQRINPPTQPIYYQYYQVQDTDNTYLCIILDCKNVSSLELGADRVSTVKVKYNDKYTYSSFSTIEDRTLGFSYTNITNIDPLTSKKVYYLAEMPKTIADETDTPVEVEIKIDNNTYYYKVR